MNYYSLTSMVEASDFEEWIVVEDGPDPSLTTVIYVNDAAVSLQWGREHMHGDSWTESWSSKFPDPKVRGYFADIRYNGVTVRSELMISVDVGRGVVPTGFNRW